MTKNSVNLQDSFLNQVRRDGRKVQFVLTSGEKLEGVVAGFDNFTVVLYQDDMKHLVYKHAIAQLVTRRGAEDERHSAEAETEAGAEGNAESQDAPARQGRRNGAPKKPAPGAGPAHGEKRNFNPLDLSGISIDKTAASP